MRGLIFKEVKYLKQKRKEKIHVQLENNYIGSVALRCKQHVWDKCCKK